MTKKFTRKKLKCANEECDYEDYDMWYLFKGKRYCWNCFVGVKNR
jgi:hypothetical protein